jgi:hypothetical protein
MELGKRERDLLEHLNLVNEVKISSVTEDAFKTYGRIVEEYDFSELTGYMEEHTEVPEKGNVYVASVPELENFKAKEEVEAFLYGGMPVQIGYCNGRNATYNGFEYHKCSEINVAVTDFMLVLGHVWDIKDHTFQMEEAEIFFVPKGCAIEMYQTTLHLSPCKAGSSGFKNIVILAKGTNTPLEKKPHAWQAEGDSIRTNEDVLLLQRNKWVLAHKDRKPLIDQGAYPGAIGENRELRY